MTNYEWLKSLSINGLTSFLLDDKCTHCAFEHKDCKNETCYDGIKKWLEKEYSPNLKPCPVCHGKMDIRWQHSGCYLVCDDCGLHYGLNADIADDMGIIEGGYRKEAALIADWNRRFDNAD